MCAKLATSGPRDACRICTVSAPSHRGRDRRSKVVGIFPYVRAPVRLVGAILLGQDDEWMVAERRSFSAESVARLTSPAGATSAQESLMAIA